MKVFVYEAYFPAGGTYMSYEIGRVLKRRFGCEVIAVGTPDRPGLFVYPDAFPVVDDAHFEREVGAEDLLICNPSFSPRMFGLRLPCRKLCYVQGVRTYGVLDVFFDRYVFVSQFARRFVSTNYGLDGPVINAFLDDRTFRPDGDWLQRRPVFLLSERKHDDLVFRRFLDVYRSKYAGADLPTQILPLQPQSQLGDSFRSARYYLSLDAMEGFGLPMLEAMASGCAAAGWDSGGCREYAIHGENALLARYGDFDTLAAHVHRLLHDPAEGQRVARAAAATGPRFHRPRFEEAWTRELAETFSLRPL